MSHFMLDMDEMRRLVDDETLDNLVRGGRETVQRMAADGKSTIYPLATVLAVDAKGERQLLVVPDLVIDEHRYKLFARVGRMIVALPMFPLAILFISEGWAATMTHAEAAQRKPGERIADRPDRREVAVIVAQSADGRTSSTQFPILRASETDPLVLGAEESGLRCDLAQLSVEQRAQTTPKSDLLAAFFQGALQAADAICRRQSQPGGANEPTRLV